MLDKQLRQIKEDALQPLARATGAYLSPTAITLMGGVAGVSAAGCALMGWYGIGLGLWLLNRVLDGLDGTVARICNQQSDLGSYIDILTDNVVYALIPVALALSVSTMPVYMALGVLLASFYVNSASWMFLSALLEKRKQGASLNQEMTSVTMPAGLIEGTETIIFYVLFFACPGILDLLFALMGVLVWVTIVQRMWWAQRHLA
ncbi:MAG: CDP-alcohol phosphatidyltransferase family protein [Anaerolineae bacterium]